MAGLFSGRSSETIDEEPDSKDEEDGSKAKLKNNDTMKNTIKSRKAFQMALTDKTMTPAIVRLNRIGNFIMLCLVTIAIVDYSTVFS